MDSILFYGGLILISVAWTAYLAVIPTEKVPERPVIHSFLMGLGMLLMLVGFVGPLLARGDVSIGTIIALLFGVGFGALFFYLLSIAKLPDGELRVAIGEPLIAFGTTDSTGQNVNTADWQGKRILLKFFRGKW